MTEPPAEPESGERTVVRSTGSLSRLTAEERQDLVAYIDGELSVDEERRLDQILSQNAVARREVARLEEVYDFLDYLPREDASTDFTAATMHSIRRDSAAPSGLAIPDLKIDVRPILMSAAVGFVITLAAAAGLRYARPAGSAVTADDLPVLNELSGLRAAGDRAFLDWVATDAVRRDLEETAR